jgi:hypothetical protein
MDIKKILKIESPIHLFRILESYAIIDNATGDVYESIRYYMDLASEYLYGCQCEEEKNWLRLKSEYSDGIRQSEVYEYIVKTLECDRIDFSEDYE